MSASLSTPSDLGEQDCLSVSRGANLGPYDSAMCLICGERIESGLPTPSDGVAFVCEKHGEYAVARSALPRFLNLNLEAREGALDRAKLFAPHRHGDVIVTSLDL
jgi:hypothetical protein